MRAYRQERLAEIILTSVGVLRILRPENDTKAQSAGDFVITSTRGTKIRKLKIEVGGASKKLKGADYVIRDDIDYPAGKALPLWLLGMGW